MKVFLQIPLSPFTGYGNDGIGLAQTLMKMGVDVYIDPTTVQGPLPEDVAMLLTKTVTPRFDLAIVHLNPMEIAADPGVRRVSDVMIAWTMWEWSNFKNLDGRSTLKKRLADFDAIVAYDPVTAAAFKQVTKVPVLTVQGGFLPEEWKYVERDWFSEDFNFGMIGVLDQRKNPWVAIAAFGELNEEHEDFREHAHLHLKTSRAGLHPMMEQAYPGLHIYYEMWPTATVKEYYAKLHVLLAPSRGEGKNMPALEFQSTGAPVMATNWGGHTMWLTNDTSWALEYDLVATEGFPDTYWAEVDKDDLKAKMLEAFRNRALTREKGYRASRYIPVSSSWDRAVEHLLLKLDADIPRASGIWAKSQASLRKARNDDD